MNTYIHAYINTYIHTHIHTYIHALTRICQGIMHAYTYVCIYIHTYIHTPEYARARGKNGSFPKRCKRYVWESLVLTYSKQFDQRHAGAFMYMHVFVCCECILGGLCSFIFVYTCGFSMNLHLFVHISIHRHAHMYVNA